MVYLAPPFHIIEGVSIFTDHEDPLQFYFLPLMPHLTEIKDPVAGINVPQIQLIKYRGEEEAERGGFLNFDVNLGIDEELLDDIRQQIRSLFKLKDQPRIAPVPLVDGSVKLIMLGRESGDTAPVTDENAPKFVVKMTHHAKPALFGSNQASFSVQLDEAGVVVVEKALQGEMAPIGVVYSLDYHALRMAYSVRVKADWDRVQKHLQESVGVNVLFFSSQVDKVVDELIESRAIVLEIDNFIPPGEDASEIIGRLDQAVNEVKDMVLENFFEPSLDPMKEPEEDGWDRFASTAERLALLHASGGLSGMAGFTMKKVDITRIDKKRLDVNMSERTVVKRSIYPQAHLRGLFRVLRDGNLDLNRFVIAVDLDDEWFEERRVKIISRANFDTDNVESINVKLKYNNKPQNVILDKNRPEATLRWNSAFVNGKLTRDIEATYTVAFKNVDSSERPVKLSSPKEMIDIENYEIRPHELYTLVQIPIIALDFPWNVYTHVEVQMRYQDAKNHIRIDDTMLLDSENPEKRWNLFTLDPAINSFEYKLTYRSVDHRDVEMPWSKTDAEQVIIRDPYPKKRRLQVVPAFNWNEVNMVFVDVAYEDAKNNIRENYSLTFNPSEAQPKTVEVKKFVNPEHRFMTYKATIIYQDGRVLESPSSVTLADRALISSQMRGHKIVTIQSEAVVFSAKKLKEIEVFLKYEDTKAGLLFVDSFTFLSHEDLPRYFEFDFADAQKMAFQYQVIYTYKNGLQKKMDWKTANENTLLVKVI